MAEEGLKNPYKEEIDPNQRILIGKGACWTMVVLFLITILAPPLYRNVKDAIDGEWVPVTGLFKFNPEDKNTPTLVHHLRVVESKIEKAEYRTQTVRELQKVMLPLLSVGNQKVWVGDDGWLFFRPAVKGLTGYGPLKPEPSSPMKDPTVKGWSPPLPAIKKFAAQLEERGVELVMVPIPVKPMIYPEMIDGREHDGPVRHRDSDAFFEELREAGVDVLDLSDAFWKRKVEGHQVFLKQDTHWTSDTMREAAQLVAEHLKKQPYFADIAASRSFEESPVDRTHIGDLVQKLELHESGLFEVEAQELDVVIDPDTGKPVEDDEKSPVVLLGDSFVNIFDDAGIGFGDPDWQPETDPETGLQTSEPPLGAGFRRHLARELGIGIDTIAENGGGATDVRKSFARKGDNQVRAKKVVVWALASRDLFLSETPARDADVSWEDVTFNPNDVIEMEQGGFVATATLIDKAPFVDPNEVTYRDALFACLYRIETVEEGEYEADEVLVWQWAFRDKKLLPTSAFEVGRKYRLALSPWAAKKSLQTLNKSSKQTLELRFDLTQYFVESGEEVE